MSNFVIGMTFRDRISLTWRYGRVQLLVGTVYNLVCAQLLLVDFSYSFVVYAFILKCFLTAFMVYVIRQFRDRDAVYFYINLGLSTRRLQATLILADFLLLAVLLTSILLIHG